MSMDEAGRSTDGAALPARPFTLMDALIAIGALAVALAPARLTLYPLWMNVRSIPVRELTSGIHWTSKAIWRGTDPPSLMIWSYGALAPFVLTGSIAYLIMRFRRPRPPWPELKWQPGMFAHLVLGGALLALTVLSVVVLLLNGLLRVPLFDRVWGAGIIQSALFASTVPLAWSVLAWRGRWKVERSWIDRLGRGLALGWSLDACFLFAAGSLSFYWS